MNPVRTVAVVLIVAGIVGLALGSVSYTRDRHSVTFGPIEFSMKEKETVNIPVWAGVGALVVGGLLLLFGGRKS